MRVLVWQWGRRGAGPRVAAELAAALRLVPGVEALLSLSTGAEILRLAEPPRCDLPVPTYEGVGGFVRRILALPAAVPRLCRTLRRVRPDVAICAMPAPLDLLMMRALKCARIPTVTVVHDADPHPGDGLPFQMALQRRQARDSDALVALTEHVAQRLREQSLADDGADAAGGRGGARGRKLFRSSLPPLPFGPDGGLGGAPCPPAAHGGPLRLLSFGRLLPYKGLDLLEAALRRVGPAPLFEVRIVGSGPESDTLRRLRTLDGVSVENRWVPEQDVGALLAWADALVLSHREASQSGVAAAAIAARRWVVSTRVGGLAEQLAGQAGAVLCEPDEGSLADALHDLLKTPPPIVPDCGNPRAAWAATAAQLVRQIDRELLGGRAGGD